mmetsp:Transcript_37031/g.93020  ORF Transcript_37031/g.93020 Transcript_37031/m.93020 type:complete len:110 (-) Transcript_37031:4975-5304(-)
MAEIREAVESKRWHDSVPIPAWSSAPSSITTREVNCASVYENHTRIKMKMTMPIKPCAKMLRDRQAIAQTWGLISDAEGKKALTIAEIHAMMVRLRRNDEPVEEFLRGC